MSEQTKSRIEYMMILVRMFAERYGLSDRQSFNYLLDYHGIELFEKCYEAFHTLPYEDVVEDVARYCHRQGGYLS